MGTATDTDTEASGVPSAAGSEGSPLPSTGVAASSESDAQGPLTPPSTPGSATAGSTTPASTALAPTTGYGSGGGADAGPAGGESTTAGGSPEAMDGSTTSSDGPGASDSNASTSESSPRVPSVLVFSKTAGYRHPSIEVGIAALRAMSEQAGWNLNATEDAARFNDEELLAFNVLLFLSPTGDVLDEGQQTAMVDFIRSGGGFVGIHAASDAEFDWPWYGALVGAYFISHPQIQQADIHVVDREHPSTQHLPALWQRTDEWYNFRAQPSGVHVLLRLDEASYDAGDDAMGDSHPIAWLHEYDGGRAFYTALGHTEQSYSEPEFLTHVREGIEWAAGSQ